MSSLLNLSRTSVYVCDVLTCRLPVIGSIRLCVLGKKVKCVHTAVPQPVMRVSVSPTHDVGVWLASSPSTRIPSGLDSPTQQRPSSSGWRSAVITGAFRDGITRPPELISARRHSCHSAEHLEGITSLPHLSQASDAHTAQ